MHIDETTKQLHLVIHSFMLTTSKDLSSWRITYICWTGMTRCTMSIFVGVRTGGQSLTNAYGADCALCYIGEMMPTILTGMMTTPTGGIVPVDDQTTRHGSSVININIYSTTERHLHYVRRRTSMHEPRCTSTSVVKFVRTNQGHDDDRAFLCANQDI